MLAREQFSADAVSTLRGMDLRYVGQQWDITIPVGAAFDAAAIRRDFEAEHDRLFGHIQPGRPIEITSIRAAGIGQAAAVEARTLPQSCGEAGNRIGPSARVDERRNRLA